MQSARDTVYRERSEVIRAAERERTARKQAAYWQAMEVEKVMLYSLVRVFKDLLAVYIHRLSKTSKISYFSMTNNLSAFPKKS